MATVSIYLNFMGTTEAAFNFYKTVFGTEFVAPIARMGEVPVEDGSPELSEEEKNMVMHVALPILGGFQIMGTDSLEKFGQNVKFGTNVDINLMPDTKEEGDRLFAELSAGGDPYMPMQDMFWGDYFGSLEDKFGVRWMINVPKEA